MSVGGGGGGGGGGWGLFVAIHNIMWPLYIALQVNVVYNFT